MDDGTEVDEEYFEVLPENTVLILLKTGDVRGKGKQWIYLILYFNAWYSYSDVYNKMIKRTS